MTLEAMKQALYALEMGLVETFHARQENAITALRSAIEAAEKQEPVAWLFQHDETGRMNYVSNDGVHNPSTFLEMNPRYALVCPLYTTPPAAQPAPVEPVACVACEGNPKWGNIPCAVCGTTPPAAPVQPVAMRMPKVGDKVVCIEDESLGTVVYLTAGGSPEIKFDDGSHGTYMLREFAELFGYTAPPNVTTPPAAQRQPLTDEQRRKLMSEAWNKWLSRKDDGRLFAWDFSFEVEAAHGITGEKT
jgi:hypothetical protein